jgi:hypothetical protein
MLQHEMWEGLSTSCDNCGRLIVTVRSVGYLIWVHPDNGYHACRPEDLSSLDTAKPHDVD